MSDLTARATLDLEDEIEKIEDDIATIENEIDSKVERAMELDEEDDEEAELFEDLEDDVDALEGVLTTYRGYKEALERATEEWEGSEFVLKELTATEVRQMKDELRRQQDRLNWEVYPHSAEEIKMLQASLESVPQGCPEIDEIGTLPNRLFDWLSSRANSLNSVGKLDMGNSSLRERMAKKRSG